MLNVPNSAARTCAELLSSSARHEMSVETRRPAQPLWSPGSRSRLAAPLRVLSADACPATLPTDLRDTRLNRRAASTTSRQHARVVPEVGRLVQIPRPSVTALGVSLARVANHSSMTEAPPRSPWPAQKFIEGLRDLRTLQLKSAETSSRRKREHPAPGR